MQKGHKKNISYTDDQGVLSSMQGLMEVGRLQLLRMAMGKFCKYLVGKNVVIETCDAQVDLLSTNVLSLSTISHSSGAYLDSLFLLLSSGTCTFHWL